MGETRTRERTGNLAVEDRPTELDNAFDLEADDEQEVAEEPWGGKLVALVRANQEVMVRCLWMDGEVTLGTAMTTFNYPPNMTAADEPFLISVVDELLANRVKKTEVSEKEEGEEEPAEVEGKKILQEEKAVRTPEPNQKTKTEIDKPPIKPKTLQVSRSPEKIIDTPQDLKVAIIREEKPPEHANETTRSAVEVISGSANDEPVQPTKNSVASESVIHLSKSPVNITHTDNPAATEMLSVTTSTLETLEEEPGIDRTKIGTKRHPRALKITAIEAPAPSVIEEHPALAEPQRITDQKPEPLVRIQVTEESEPTKPIDKIVEVSEDQPTPVTPDYQMDTSGIIDFDDEEVLINHFEDGDIRILETIEYGEDIEKVLIPQTVDELNVTEQEVVDLKQPVQANLIADEIESSLMQLAERVKFSDPQVTEMANENLDKIIETVAKLEVPSSNNIVTEAKAQEEIEELFTKFFDTMSIDYTPKLINYLARQTLTWYLVDEIEKLKDGEEAEEVPPDSVIHAIIKKLIAALKAIKRTMTHTCAIGRAALVLCSFYFQTGKPTCKA